jgi:transcription initiation factor TFIIB
MRRQHNRARLSSKRDRNQAYALTEIQRLVGALGLSDAIAEQACALFESAQSKDLLMGRSLEGFAAASVYATCRVGSLARTMDEIVTVARANKSELKAAYSAMNSELGLPVGPIDPAEYLPRYTSALGLAADIESRAREYVDALCEHNAVSGKNPSGVAAACLYKAAEDFGGDITQTAVADVANVSRMTVRSTVDDLDEIGLSTCCREATNQRKTI